MMTRRGNQTNDLSKAFKRDRLAPVLVALAARAELAQRARTLTTEC